MAKPDNNKRKILLVDDDPHVLLMLNELFRLEYDALMASSGEESIRLVRENKDIATVVMDIKMPNMDGITAAREIRKIEPDVPVIFHTGYPGDYDEDEIDALEKPFDYIQKGEPVSKLTRSVRNAVESFLLRRNENETLSLNAETDYNLIGRSRAMQSVYQLIKKVSAGDAKVVIVGETGTGKELVARAIHFNSRRRDNRFAFLACNQKSSDIVESELFGHQKGAFTGAVSDRIGLFEYADGGTVFLDEVGDLDIVTQGKLLRVLETGEYQSIGSPIVKTANIRILCATHKNLERLVANGHFREDLYFRLKGIKIAIPPLRERKEDIPLLVDKFKDRFTIEQGLPPKIFDRSAIAAMLEYDWPGNVRQLLDTVESLITLCDSDIIVAEDVAGYLGSHPDMSRGKIDESRKLAYRLREYRRICIIEALNETGNNVSAAAKILGVDRSNLRKMIRDFDINTK
jgi:DNA-binding NtrC family response regulator